MHVVNIHKRIINQPKLEVAGLLETLSTKDDKVWPNKKWLAMRFKDGLKAGAKGGHGIIRYAVEAFVLGELIVFKFLKPKGFKGIHKFEIQEINASTTEVKHSIIMKINNEDIDKLIKETLTEEEAKFYDDLDEQGVWGMVGGIFKGKLGWLVIIMNIINLVVFGFFIYCLIQFFDVTETNELIKWGLGVVICLIQ